MEVRVDTDDCCCTTRPVDINWSCWDRNLRFDWPLSPFGTLPQLFFGATRDILVVKGGNGGSGG